MVGREGLRPLRGAGGGARSPADEGRGAPPPGGAEPWRARAGEARARPPSRSAVSSGGSVVQRVVVRDGAGRHGAEDAVVLVLFGQAPGRVDVVGLCPTLGTSSRRLRRRPLQTARFLEAPMASLFHENSLSHPDRILASAPLRPDRTGHVDRPIHCSGCGRRACPGPGQDGRSDAGRVAAGAAAGPAAVAPVRRAWKAASLIGAQPLR